MKIDFEFDSPHGKYSDTLWFSNEESLPTEEQIEAMKLERFNNWLAIINPPVEGE
jgi:hypothetical protein